MCSTFDRWEKDPFFSAAEEVQESADRMESIYRRWMNERKAKSNEGTEEVEEDITGELRRELHTSLGTTKWQLEEFDRASKTRDQELPADDDARTRHVQFVTAIGTQVHAVENSLRESEMEDDGQSGLPWVRLDEGERDELAAFLSGSLPVTEVKIPVVSLDEDGGGCLKEIAPPTAINVMLDARIQAHRRSASASNDSGMWAISLANEDGPTRALEDRSLPKMPKVSSMSRLAGSSELTVKLPKNGFRKWKQADQLQAWESIPLHHHHENRGLHACYERCKSCMDSMDSCGDEPCNKQLYGWAGTFQRQLQRSQYQIQYARPVQMFFWGVAALLLIVLFVLRAM